MIDLTREKPISLREAPAHVPRPRRGKKLHISTLYRWIADGVCGVRLEVVYLGGSPATTVEALHRFFAAVAAAKTERGRAAAAVAPAPRQRQAAVRAAQVNRHLDVERELDRVLGPRAAAGAPAVAGQSED